MLLLLACAPAWGEDWPTWRGDAARSGAVDAPLPDGLHLHWVRRLGPQSTAWKDEAVMKFDRSYLPVASGELLFVGSTVNDRLTAYDLQTGAEKWRFYAGGPIRAAPAAWRDNVYLAGDDGFLHCLRAADGRLLWRFRGGPRDRRLIGNERLISTWPARGGPVVADDPWANSGRAVVYFAAGVWPFMGTFVHALDAETGRAIWTNDSTSFTFRRMPHPGSAAFNGLSAQGHLAVAGDRLIVPGSASTPAIFDRKTGEFLFYGEGSGPHACAQGRFAFAGGHVFEIHTGYAVRFKDVRRLSRPVLTPRAWYTSDGVYDPTSARIREKTIRVPETTRKDGPTYPKQVFEGTIERVGDPKRRVRLGTPWLLAGSRLVTTGNVTRSRAPKGHTSVQILDVSDPAGEAKVTWQTSVEGEVSDVIAAGGRLVVVTLEGDIHCFGAGRAQARTHALPEPKAAPAGAWADRAKGVLEASGADDGYCLVCGLKDGGLVQELLRQSRLHVVAVDGDAGRIDALRRRLDEAGLYGSRAAAVADETSELSSAPYLASLIVSEDPARAGLAQGEASVRRLFQPLRPYGGTACLPLSAEQHEQLTEALRQAGLTGAEVKRVGALTLLRRPGPLPGAAPWLGQNADAGGTRCSRDRLVRAPLGVLWFGNALSNSLILPRHGEGPVEQVAGGRMFIEGPDSLSASDVYTGRLLWSRWFPGLGAYYSVPKHSRGAHAIGSNFFVAPDAVYVSAGEACHVLDPATGTTRKQFTLPGESDWLFLLVYEDLLVAGAEPIVQTSGKHRRITEPGSSRRLVVMDRRDGRVLWTRIAASSFGHYAIAAGAGKVFCIDQVAPEAAAKLARRGESPDAVPHVLALDARSGKVIWQSDRCVGGKLSYSEPYDVVLSAGALRGKDGQVLWHYGEDKEEEIDPAAGPVVRTDVGATCAHLWWGKWGPMLHGRTILTQQFRAFDLLTGRLRTWTDAAGELRPWRYYRSHGCGPAAGGELLITFRSGCAGFFDLARDGGTGNLGGFRAGCTSNLIVADGVLNAPDYTRLCGCAYQNRSSLGLIHMPDVEYWTFGGIPAPGRAGFNFGAPGDRRAEDGTLWRETPCAALPRYGGQTLVATVPETPRRFYHHVSRMRDQGPLRRWEWVAASGLIGVRRARVPLDGVDESKELVVRLVFCEPEHTEPGRRVFGVALDGKELLKNLDVVKEAGGPFRAVVREFRGIRARGGALELTFSGSRGEPLICGVELIQADRLGGKADD